jgi:hypothetical protein
VSKELQRADLGLWRAGAHGLGLFPRAAAQGRKDARDRFKGLGRLLGQAVGWCLLVVSTLCRVVC